MCPNPSNGQRKTDQNEYIRKSGLEAWIQCPKRYELLYLKGYEAQDTIEMQIGRIFHKFARDLFYWIDYDELQRLSNRQYEIYDPHVYEYFETLIYNMPKLVEPLCRNFILFEAKRWTQWLRSYSNPLKYFKPVDVEREIVTPAIGLRGTVDRIDNIPEGLVVIEYKTGKRQLQQPSTPHQSYYQALRRELAFYSILINDSHIYETPVTHIAYYNPRTEESFCELLTKGLVDVARRRIRQLTDARAIGKYPRREGDHCSMCIALRPCLEDRNHEKENI